MLLLPEVIRVPLALQAGSCKHHNRRKSPASNGNGFNHRNPGSSLRSLLICPRRQGVPNNLAAFRRFNLLHAVLVYIGDMAWGDAFAVKLILQALKEGIVGFLSTTFTSLLIQRARGFDPDVLMARQEAIHPLLAKELSLSALGQYLLRHSGKLCLYR